MWDISPWQNVREPEWGQTPLMFAAGAGRTDAAKLLLARGAEAGASAKVVDISARNREDSAQNREHNARVAAIQKQLALRRADARSGPAAGAPQARGSRGRGDGDSGGEPEPSLRAASNCVEVAQRFKPDALLGLGGGSNMDLAKIAATVRAAYTEAIADRKSDDMHQDVLQETTLGASA